MREIKNPENYLINESFDESYLISGWPELGLIFSSQDNVWNYYFSKSNLDETSVKVMTGLCALISGKSPLDKRIFGLNLREVENFLRVENDKAVFQLNEQLSELVNKSLERWAMRGFYLFLREKSEKKPEIWPENFISRINIIQKIFDEEILPRLKEVSLNIEFIALEGDSVIFRLERPEEFFLLEGIKLFLNEKIEKVSLNIVAEE